MNNNPSVIIYDRWSYTIATIHHWHIAAIVINQYMNESYPITAMYDGIVIWDSSIDKFYNVNEIHPIIVNRINS